MSGLTKQVINGKQVFKYNGKQITPSKYYQLRYKLTKN